MSPILFRRQLGSVANLVPSPIFFSQFSFVYVTLQNGCRLVFPYLHEDEAEAGVLFPEAHGRGANPGVVLGHVGEELGDVLLGLHHLVLEDFS